MGKAAIEIQGITKYFGEEMILKNITHTFESGKIHGIVGMNGSGKTVLLKCICGFLRPSEGKILVEGKWIGKETDFPESLGMIIENPGFLPNLSGRENLKILASLRGKIGKEEIQEAMEKVGLDFSSPKKVGLDFSSPKPVKNYSLGMRERLGIAQAIMEDPHIIILDEPFNGLDKNGVQEVYRIIQDLKNEQRTILLVSHNRVDIETLCDTVCEMELGVLRRIL